MWDKPQTPEAFKETLKSMKTTALGGHIETPCYFQQLLQFSLRNRGHCCPYVLSVVKLSRLPYTCLFRCLNGDPNVIILLKVEMHFFLLISLESVVKVTPAISKRILLGVTHMTSVTSSQTLYSGK